MVMNKINELNQEIAILKQIILNDKKEIDELKETIWDLKQENYEG